MKKEEKVGVGKIIAITVAVVAATTALAYLVCRLVRKIISFHTHCDEDCVESPDTCDGVCSAAEDAEDENVGEAAPEDGEETEGVEDLEALDGVEETPAADEAPAETEPTTEPNKDEA